MKDIVALLLGGIIGLSAVFYFILYPETWSFNSGIIIIASIIVSIPLSILLHELGHFLTGLLQGMRLLNLSVGPFVIERHKGKLHFHVVGSVLGFLGRAMMGFPEHLNKEVMRKKLIRYIYGGPVTNIVLAALSLALAFGTWHHPFLLVFGLLNLLLGVMNLKPVMANSVMTDGLVIQKLKSVPVEESVILTSYMILTEGLKSEDVKQWPPALIEQLERMVTADDPTAKSYLPTISYYYFPNEAEKVLKVGQPVAFIRETNKPDYYADTADIAFATALFFEGKLTSYSGVEKNLRSIGKVDKIIDLKRNALLSYTQGHVDEAIQNLQEAKESLSKWHPLYLRGEMEKRLIGDMIEVLNREA